MFLPRALPAEQVSVRHKEGVAHGFLVLSTQQGETLATGDQIQTIRGDRVTTELIFHFKDGSLHDEVTVFSQQGAFRLLIDHLVQQGPSFPHPIDVTIDATKGEVLVQSLKDGKQKLSTEHLDIPEDAANGMVLTLLRNISSSTSETSVSMVATSSRPKVVKLKIHPEGVDEFSVSGSKRTAIHYVVKVEIGGVAGVIAPITGKQPPDTHIWVLAGRVPTFLRFEGTLYEGGPIWRIKLATLKWSEETTPAKKPGSDEK
jgi:hypothetical protein